MDFWFHTFPAILLIPMCLSFAGLFAQFVPGAVRHRDGKMLAALGFGYVYLGAHVFLAVHTLAQGTC